MSICVASQIMPMSAWLRSNCGNRENLFARAFLDIGHELSALEMSANFSHIQVVDANLQRPHRL